MTQHPKHRAWKLLVSLVPTVCTVGLLLASVSSAGIRANAALVLPPSQHKSADADASTGARAASGPMHDYLLACSGCHGFDGSGSPSGDIPSLAGMRQMLRTDAGRDYIMRLPGTVDAPLTDIRLAALLNWAAIRFSTRSASAPADDQAFTPEEVAGARSRPLQDPVAARTRLTRDPTGKGDTQRLH